ARCPARCLSATRGPKPPSTVNAGRRAGASPRIRALYFASVLCRDRRRAQTYALSLNDDHGGAVETGCASPPRSGKPDGFPALPLEPRVQGRLARIDMAEDVFIARPASFRHMPARRWCGSDPGVPRMSHDGKALRRAIRENRRATPASERIAAAERLAERLLALPF